MKYSVDDVKFNEITPREFENLCYDLLVNYNFQKIIWREGGADSGRDIEASYTIKNQICNTELLWFFECKHYTSGGVPPDDLNSKIAWADAEAPDFLVLFLSSYLTNGARTWIEKIANQKKYNIVIIEGEDLKNRLIQYPELIERYFSLSSYEKLLKDVRDSKIKFNIYPSFEILREIVNNIQIERLTLDEIGFILINYYTQFDAFKGRADYYGDFKGNEVDNIVYFLKDSIINQELKSFQKYKDNYDILGGTGIFTEFYYLDDEDIDYEIQNYNFQVYDLHLNHKKEQEKWKIGYYLFIRIEDIAIELFQVESTEIRIIPNFTDEKIRTLSLNLDSNVESTYKRYLNLFN